MGIVAIKWENSMKKFLKVKQEEGTSIVQVSYDNSNYFTSRFAAITVVEGQNYISDSGYIFSGKKF